MCTTNTHGLQSVVLLLLLGYLTYPVDGRGGLSSSGFILADAGPAACRQNINPPTPHTFHFHPIRVPQFLQQAELPPKTGPAENFHRSTRKKKNRSPKADYRQPPDVRPKRKRRRPGQRTQHLHTRGGQLIFDRDKPKQARTRCLSEEAPAGAVAVRVVVVRGSPLFFLKEKSALPGALGCAILEVPGIEMADIAGCE